MALLAVPAAAQDKAQDDPTLNPNQITVATKRPPLQPFGYAKLAKTVLVIDPMKKTIIAILPRQSPTSGNDLPPADWAAKRGRELTGQAPEQPAAKDEAPEPAGDSGDRSNGNEKNATEK